jgi:two-component system sensor histidine kinase KdpD
VEAEAQRLALTVADDGPGLPAGLGDRLFEKFARGDSAKAGGLGLGLSLVRGFIQAQGGQVVAADRPGGGAVFTIYLPHVAPQSTDLA